MQAKSCEEPRNRGGDIRPDDVRNLTIQIKREEGIAPMSDAYAIHLFNTIDTLIPGDTRPIPQPETRARQETQPPKALPPARRRPRQ